MTTSVPGTRPRRWAASRAVLRAVWRRPTGLFGLLVLTALVLTALVSLVWTPDDPMGTNLDQAWLLPLSGGHLLGTDRLGHDQLSQLMAGARETVLTALSAAVLAALVGLVLALTGTLSPRWLRAGVVQLIDILIAFPTLLLAMVLAAVYGGSTATAVVAIGIGFGVNVARVTRAEIAAVRGSDYVLAAQACGAGTGRIVRRHLLPNVAPTLIVQLSLTMALAVLAEAALTYLGYGTAADIPSWGGMLREQQAYLTARPLLVIWPGLAVAVTVLGLNLLGDALREATDPRLRGEVT